MQSRYNKRSQKRLNRDLSDKYLILFYFFYNSVFFDTDQVFGQRKKIKIDKSLLSNFKEKKLLKEFNQINFI